MIVHFYEVHRVLGDDILKIYQKSSIVFIFAVFLAYICRYHCIYFQLSLLISLFFFSHLSSFIFAVIIVLADFLYARETVLFAAQNVGLTEGDHVFIMFALDHDYVLSKQRNPKKWFILPHDKGDPYYRCKYQQAFDSVLLIASNVYQNIKILEKFQDLVRQKSPEPPFYINIYNKIKNAYVSSY